jgi:hypothetical protein
MLDQDCGEPNLWQGEAMDLIAARPIVKLAEKVRKNLPIFF